MIFRHTQQHGVSRHTDSMQSALGQQLTERGCFLCRGRLMSRQSIKAGVRRKRVSVRTYYTRTTVMDCLGATVGASHSSVRPSIPLLMQPYDASYDHPSLPLSSSLSLSRPEPHSSVFCCCITSLPPSTCERVTYE